MEDGHRCPAVPHWFDRHRLAVWLESGERAHRHRRIEDTASEIGGARRSTTGVEA
ncbi:hypothetical protein ABTZ58_31635 [Streptomyces sp. NPDC094143]|uniref:hypothetical protein n=1 Tax=Streptomyces sp. NPDC094143 TaxID=3155310 RepID=UPI0033167625